MPKRNGVHFPMSRLFKECPLIERRDSGEGMRTFMRKPAVSQGIAWRGVLFRANPNKFPPVIVVWRGRFHDHPRTMEVRPGSAHCRIVILCAAQRNRPSV